MSDIKMSEVFKLPVVKWNYSNLLRDQSDTVICNYPKGIELSAHAINTHDTLVAQNLSLKAALAEVAGSPRSRESITFLLNVDEQGVEFALKELEGVGDE